LQQQQEHLPNKYIELTGNPFVDTGLAALAALSNCRTIDQLTLRRIRNVHNGRDLARNNSILQNMSTIFTKNSLLTNPNPSKAKEREKSMSMYAKITTAILNNIGHEQIDELCEMCGNSSSIDLSRVCGSVERNKDGETSNKFIGRDWFPLSGSIANDAQCFPSASRPLNCCAMCLFAVQYLPQSVMVTKEGDLTIFQSTSRHFWYQIVRDITNRTRALLSSRHNHRATIVNTMGSTQEERGIAVNAMLDIMQRIKLEPGTSLITWQFNNSGKVGRCQIDEIPNFALSFLDKARQLGLREEINRLLEVERQKKSLKYNNSFLNCISKRLDYSSQYPSPRRQIVGVSHKFFELYQTLIRGYSVQKLRTAYKIAQYILDSKLDSDNKRHKNFGIDIDSKGDRGQRTRVRSWIVDMVKDKEIRFEEYYDLFVINNNDRNPWSLIKYYLLRREKVTQFRSANEEYPTLESEHKNAVIEIGTRLYDSIMKRKSEERFKREILIGFAANRIGEGWLRRQFEILTEESEGEFDYNDSWNRLCDNGEINVYEVLYLLRLLFTVKYYH
jgi:hypothetical protein